MTKLIQISDDLWIQPRKVIAIKRSGVDDDQSTVFMSGQSAVDGGFVVDREMWELAEDVNRALADDDVDENEGDNHGRQER